MVSVEEASRIIFSRLMTCEAVPVPIALSVGKVLAEPVYADRPFPPFDRVSMDGIAISFEAYTRGVRKFAVESVQAAGEPRKQLYSPDHCLEVMTGAILPQETDTVIRYEDISIEDKYATVNEAVTKGQNVHTSGLDAKENDLLLRPGMSISSAEVALFASVGNSTVSVKDFPRIAIVSTGDELVDVNEIPLPHQVRRSNVYALQAAATESGIGADLYHIKDNKATLINSLTELLSNYEVLIVSGGVSKGKFDFIPEVLETLGIKKEFHQVNQRPGKPFWFGRSDSGKTVFALPGNPVSTFMCFYKYVRPWIEKSLSLIQPDYFAVLREDVSFLPKLTYFIQVNVKNEKGILQATPVVGKGSGDFANLKDVTGFLELPPDRSEFRMNEAFRYIPFRR